MPKSADLFANQKVFNRLPTYDSCAMDICSCPPPTLSTYPSQPAFRKAKQSTKLILTLVSVLCGARATQCGCSKVNNHGLEGCSISGFRFDFQHKSLEFSESYRMSSDTGLEQFPTFSTTRVFSTTRELNTSGQTRNHNDDTHFRFCKT